MEMPYSIDIGVRDRGGGQLPATQNFGKPWKFGQTLGKIKKIRADISPVLLCLLMDFEASHDVEKVIH